MSNKTSHHLFELIHSLNKSEKRYFKLYASRHTIGEQNNYITLFDYIANQKEYNEKKLFKKFKNSSFLNQFSTTKSRLYQLILKSLDLFHSSNSIEAQINTTIHSADILFNKGLYTQSEKLYKQAEKQAKKHQKFAVLLEIKNKQKKLYEKEMYCHLNKNKIVTLYEQEKQLIRHLKDYSFLWHIKSLLLIKINEIGEIRTTNDLKELEQIISKAKSIEITTCPLKVKQLYHHLFSMYFATIKAYQSSYFHLKENLQIFSKNSLHIQHRFNAYISVLTNLVFVCTKLKYYQEANDHINTLNSIPQLKFYDSSTDLKVKYLSNKFSLELFLHIEQNNYAKAKKLIPKISEFLSQYNLQINPIRKSYLDFKIATVYLVQDKYSDALHWINLILNNKALDKRQDLYSFAKIIHLIIHYELKNYTYLTYALNATKRYLKNKERVYKFESIFLKAISKISKDNVNQFDIEEILLPYLNALKALKQNKFEESAFDYFDFYTWLKSKANGKSYIDLKIAG